MPTETGPVLEMEHLGVGVRKPHGRRPTPAQPGCGPASGAIPRGADSTGLAGGEVGAGHGGTWVGQGDEVPVDSEEEMGKGARACNSSRRAGSGESRDQHLPEMPAQPSWTLHAQS